MKTLDGYILQEGEECYVEVDCASGDHHLGTKPRKALYLDDIAKSSGWDFTLARHLKVDCESIEILAVWKHKPEQKAALG